MRMSTLALVAAGLVALGGCTGNDPVAAAPSPTPEAPSPTPSPTPELEPVAGERLPTSVDIGDGKLLGPDDRETVDEEAVRAFAATIFDWLDGHLDDLQRGGAGRLDEVLDPGLAASLDDAARAALTTSLASGDAPVATATYTLTAYHDATIEYATVEVAVTDRAGAPHRATLVFTRGPEGAPVLTLADAEVAA